MLTKWSMVVSCGLVAAGLLHAQDGRVYLPEQTGVWRSRYESPMGVAKVSAADLATLRSALGRIEEAVHATPMLSPPRGFDIRTWQRLDLGCPSQPRLCRPSLPGWITFAFEDYRTENGTLTTLTEEPPHVDVAFNDPVVTYVLHHAGSPGLFDPSGNEIVGQPVEIGRVGGFPLYDNGVVLVGRNPRPFFVPASREQYLRALLAQAESTATGGGSTMVRDGVGAELAALSPAERSSQAFTDVNSPAFSLLAPSSQKGATPMVMFNPDYFEASLPRTAIQLITVRYPDLEDTRGRFSERPDLLQGAEPLTAERLAFVITSGVGVASYRILQLHRLLDYSRLAALLAAPGPAAASARRLPRGWLSTLPSS